MKRHLHDLSKDEVKAGIDAMVKRLDIGSSTLCYDLYKCVFKEWKKAIDCHEKIRSGDFP